MPWYLAHALVADVLMVNNQQLWCKVQAAVKFVCHSSHVAVYVILCFHVSLLHGCFAGTTSGC